MDFIDNLQVRNTLAGTLGQAYERLAGIPRGDPLSMLVTALVMQAWIRQMHDRGFIPRILADDLAILVLGVEALKDFVEAFDLTHKHLMDMGARIAPAKCHVYSSDLTWRMWLMRHRWRFLGRKIPVSNDGRDLGAHYNALASRAVGTTLTGRTRATAMSAARLAKMRRIPYAVRAVTIRTKLLPKALYGCELSPINEAAMGTLRINLADNLCFKTARRSIDLTFATASYGGDLDPDIEVVVRRVVPIRRIHSKNEELAKLSLQILRECGLRGEPGVYDEELGHEGPADLVVAGPPGSSQRMLARRKCKPLGPVGFLLESAHLQAAAIGHDFTWYTYNQGGMPLIRMPYQHLPVLIREHCMRNRTRFAQGSRNETVDLFEIDTEATTAGDKQRDEDKQRLVTLVRTGAQRTREAAFWAGHSDAKTCSLCGAMGEGSDHFWYCTALYDCRCVADPILAAINPDVLPNPLRHGIAPALVSDIGAPFWGGPWSDNIQPEVAIMFGAHDIAQDDEEVGNWMRQVVDMHTDFEVPVMDSVHSGTVQGPIKTARCTARQAMQIMTQARDTLELPRPRSCDGVAPAEPNVYTDGSLKHPKSKFWHGGGFGAWWPKRSQAEAPINDTEDLHLRYEFGTYGLWTWAPISSMMNSSSRCEIAAATLAMVADVLNIASDSKALVDKGSATIEHQRMRLCANLYTDQGAPILGGTTSRLHRVSCQAKPWSLTKYGDLWEAFEWNIVAKGSQSVGLTKVKGHATNEMVESGQVRWVHTDGNDEADKAADMGVA